MDARLEDFVSYCAHLNFGPVPLSDGEKEFYRAFNHERILLCDSLPKSVRLDALMFFMKYSGLSIGQELDFYKNYYVPSWSIIYWLTQGSRGCESLSPHDIHDAMTAHAMAMILHSMDDHMNDGEIHASHLALLLRSQSWMRMKTALNHLAEEDNRGMEIVDNLINEYYSRIRGPEVVDSLDGYCDLFRGQMASWLIVPVLLSRKISKNGEFADAVEKAYGSFGIAWRLLDDIMDIEDDMKKGAHSAIYVFLPENKREQWDTKCGTDLKNRKGHDEIVLGYIMDKGLVNRIKQRIIQELESAAFTSEQYLMEGLAGEFRALLKPLGDS